jgi:hypothetical protein
VLRATEPPKNNCYEFCISTSENSVLLSNSVNCLRQGAVPKTDQRVEKLLRAIFCAPFRGLKPRLCSVLGSVSRCLASVFTTDHSENDFFNSLDRFRYKGSGERSLRPYDGGERLCATFSETRILARSRYEIRRAHAHPPYTH